ncbi:MAG TPA: ATP-binding cassette domain-containing protein [Tessaracoccus flavescens]|uniref:ATP-binding cassette domain-containing protein n=1 Tax=Tessaracoccus flavescens TaxID=399497 RepID=A0A921EQ06_9ACTN|nr:ATP-binding cassette domain-containing protein [Tessaracoccus flavescens]
MTEVRVAAQVAARGLALEIVLPDGDTVAIVGPNGAGKSSLIQLIAGSLRPDAGTVSMGGEEVAGPAGAVPVHRRRVGYLEQRALLFPHLSVLDNVAFGPRARGTSTASARARAAEELAAVGLDELASRKPSQLSGGQAQRVALARTLATDPAVVLLDEPFAALDAEVAPELRRLLRERLRGVTTVLVTHDFLDVVALADRVIELDGGRVVAHGTVEELCQRPTTSFMAGFVGLNLLHGEAVDAHTLQLSDGVTLSGIAPQPIGDGDARAVFSPASVSVFNEPPHGSPRNALPAVVTSIEDRWPSQRVGLRVGDQQLAADLTPAAVRDLELAPGSRVFAVVKATQITITGRGLDHHR